eukprot:1182332-Prorocentrum_minimum.AAC.3
MPRRGRGWRRRCRPKRRVQWRGSAHAPRAATGRGRQRTAGRALGRAPRAGVAPCSSPACAIETALAYGGTDLAQNKGEGELDRGGLQSTRPRAGQLGGPASELAYAHTSRHNAIIIPVGIRSAFRNRLETFGVLGSELKPYG